MAGDQRLKIPLAAMPGRFAYNREMSSGIFIFMAGAEWSLQRAKGKEDQNPLERKA